MKFDFEEKSRLSIKWFDEIKNIKNVLKNIEEENYDNVYFTPSLKISNPAKISFDYIDVIGFYNKRLIEIENKLGSIGINFGNLREID